MTWPSESQQKKRTSQLVDFAVPADHRVKLKENEKKNKYVDFARELKKKSIEHESDSNTNCTVTKGLVQDWKTWK